MNAGTLATHFRNADSMRLLAASAVMFSHSFLMANGSEQEEPLVRMLGEHNSLGVYAVFVFFILSGFFVAGSLPTSASVWHFLWKRLLRIYPGLLVCAVISAFVLGTVFTTVGWRQYWEQLIPLQYVGVTVVVPNLWKQIPTVEFYNGFPWMSRLINGSLWTIIYEVFCYIFIAAIFAARGLRLNVILVLLAGAVAATFFAYPYIGYVPFAASFLFLLPSFLAGVAIRLLTEKASLSGHVSLIFLAAIVALGVSHGDLIRIFPLLAAYPVVWLATTSAIRLPSLKRFGDASYGTYLYGWPVEQVMRAVLGEGASWWVIFGISLPVAILMGWLSWHMIEKHALRLRGWLPARQQREQRAAQ